MYGATGSFGGEQWWENGQAVPVVTTKHHPLGSGWGLPVLMCATFVNAGMIFYFLTVGGIGPTDLPRCDDAICHALIRRVACGTRGG